MSILILGQGLLGKELVRQTGWDFLSRSRDQFDLTVPEHFARFLTPQSTSKTPRWTTVINCIAHTQTYSPERETHWAVNYQGVADLTDFCNEHEIKLVQISTDYVYANSSHPAAETDVPVHAQNWYSYTKLLGDSYVQLRSKNFLVIRTGHKPKPFPYPQAWTDQRGNFDYVDRIAALIVKAVTAQVQGVLNIGTEAKSIYDLAKQTQPTVLEGHRGPQVPADTTMELSRMAGIIKGNEE